jgi:hypothetical protein
MFKLGTVVAGLILFAGFTRASVAGTFSYTGYGLSGENVHVTDSLLGIENEYGGAGLITLEGSTTIAAYCVDIADWLLGSGTYTSGINPATAPNLTGVSSITGHSKIADISALIAHGGNADARVYGRGSRTGIDDYSGFGDDRAGICAKASRKAIQMII